MVSLISDSTDTKLVTRKSTVGGAWLWEHWHEKRGLRTKTLIETGNYDAIVFQEYSMAAINSPDSLRKYAKMFSALARSRGARPYLFLVWARERVPQYQLELDHPYQDVAAENGMILVPVGKAWELAREYRPDAPLFHPDGTHPGPLGTYLTALTMVGVITGEVPQEYPAVPKFIDERGEVIEMMRLDWLDAVFARKVAKEAVEKYYLLGPFSPSR